MQATILQPDSRRLRASILNLLGTCRQNFDSIRTLDLLRIVGEQADKVNHGSMDEFADMIDSLTEALQ